MSALDELGFIPLDQLQNIFITELTKITEDLRVNGAPRDEKIIFEYIDSIRLRLMQKARHNLQSYLAQHPDVRAEIRQDKALMDKEIGKKTYKERIKESRDRAIKYSDSL